MARQVIPFESTWLNADRHFAKAFEGLSAEGQKDFQKRLAVFILALQQCSHPVLDPRLASLRPTPYPGVAKISGGQLIEYRLDRSSERVVACYFEQRNVVLLVAVTINHDHERIKTLIKKHKSDIGRAGSE